jgi:hypothetical protein
MNSYVFEYIAMIYHEILYPKKKKIVDIGSGKAYLSAQLSSAVFENHFNVIAIDSSENYVNSSVRRLSMMKRRTTIFSIERDRTNIVVDEAKLRENPSDETNYFRTVDPTKFQTFSQFIQSSTELNDLIREKLSSETQSTDEYDFDGHFALIGLHSCGNLSNSIVNLYLNTKQGPETRPEKLNCSNNRLLCNVACCYNLLNEKYSADVESYIDVKKTNVKIGDQSKFPMSEYLNERRYAINFNARSLACHSLDRCFESVQDFREVWQFSANGLNLRKKKKFNIVYIYSSIMTFCGIEWCFRSS